MTIEWSAEIPFLPQTIEKQVPDKAGVYQILQSVEYLRYEGKTRILKIGKSESSLKDEIANHFVRHTVANRLARIRNRPSVKVTVVFAVTPDGQAGKTESELLRRFEDECWDLPALNSQRGYTRNQDVHYKLE
jgi:hypothetical protein